VPLNWVISFSLTIVSPKRPTEDHEFAGQSSNVKKPLKLFAARHDENRVSIVVARRQTRFIKEL